MLYTFTYLVLLQHFTIAGHNGLIYHMWLAVSIFHYTTAMIFKTSAAVVD